MRWIKVRAEVVDDPAVMRIGELLGLDTPSVLGRLVLVWLWADAQTVDGSLPGVSPAMLDRVAQR
jgi:DNA replication protein DnaT